MLWNLVENIAFASKSLVKWIQRNRKKVVIGIAIGSSTIFFAHFVRKRFQLYQRELETHEKEQIRRRMQDYFEKAQKSSDSSVVFFSSKLKNRLIEMVPIPSLEQLRTSKNGSVQQKKILWENAKVQSFTRTFAAVYALCLLLLFVRVEVNILGRYLYMDNSISEETSLNVPLPTTVNQNLYNNSNLDPSHKFNVVDSEEESPITEDTQRHYLRLAEYITNTGLTQLITYVQANVENEMKEWPLERKCSPEEVDILLHNLRKRIEGCFDRLDTNPAQYQKPQRDRNLRENIDVVHKNGIDMVNISSIYDFHRFLLPVEDEHLSSSKQLICLLNETRDVLESEKFTTMLKSSLNSGFDQLREHLQQSVKKALSPSEKVVIANGLPMAKMIPLVKHAFNFILEKSPPDENFLQPSIILALLFKLKELEEYSYYIFSSSYDQE